MTSRAVFTLVLLMLSRFSFSQCSYNTSYGKTLSDTNYYCFRNSFAESFINYYFFSFPLKARKYVISNTFTQTYKEPFKNSSWGGGYPSIKVKFDVKLHKTDIDNIKTSDTLNLRCFFTKTLFTNDSSIVDTLFRVNSLSIYYTTSKKVEFGFYIDDVHYSAQIKRKNRKRVVNRLYDTNELPIRYIKAFFKEFYVYNITLDISYDYTSAGSRLHLGSGLK
ncbi:MAG: hypothetical protein COA33_013545 [Fluviicola sp.]|nr:hypothetical protein [Fluviicola sp.]